MVGKMDNEKFKVTFDSRFVIHLVFYTLIFMILFYLLADALISLKMTIVKPSLDILYGAKTPPYIHRPPTYRGISLSLVCYVSLVSASLNKNTFVLFFRTKWKPFLVYFVSIIVFEILGIVVEIMTNNFISYYASTFILSVGSILFALVFWLLLFPSLKDFINFQK